MEKLSGDHFWKQQLYSGMLGCEPGGRKGAGEDLQGLDCRQEEAERHRRPGVGRGVSELLDEAVIDLRRPSCEVLWQGQEIGQGPDVFRFGD
jgi:hypothetical protein